MRKIRASDISSFLYCQRAWWYRQQGITSENVEQLAGGRDLHERHGRAVLASGIIRSLAYLLLLAGLIMLAITFTLKAI
ncbi:MAG: Dna2/Cas4 domain-containing protein [Anaerolineae bacterium]|nr:Dna2/Cas4 domain-containing protein [Anaerolineae bacterium]